MQALAPRMVLQTRYSMPMGMRLAPAPLLRSPASFRFKQASYTTPFSFSKRSASTSSGSPEEEKTHVFVIWAPDYTDKDALARRLAVREKHIHETKPGQEAGYYLFGGAFLTPESIDAPDAPKKMAGSLLLVRAKSIEEVRTNIEADIYWKSDVWDREKVIIAPLRRAVGSILENDPDV